MSLLKRVVDAFKVLPATQRGYVSYNAIAKYLDDNGDDGSTCRVLLKACLKAAVDRGILVKEKRSYRLDDAKTTKRPRKRDTKTVYQVVSAEGEFSGEVYESKRDAYDSLLAQVLEAVYKTAQFKAKCKTLRSSSKIWKAIVEWHHHDDPTYEQTAKLLDVTNSSTIRELQQEIGVLAECLPDDVRWAVEDVTFFAAPKI